MLSCLRLYKSGYYQSWMISDSYYQDEDNDANLAYWLSNTSTLLFMLQQSLKSGGTGATPLRQSPSLVRWMTKVNILFFFFFFKSCVDEFLLQKLNNPYLIFLQGFRSPAAEAIRPVDAKDPALHFKQQLEAYVEKISGIIWDNLKKELNTVLALCIQVLWSTMLLYFHLSFVCMCCKLTWENLSRHQKHLRGMR